MTLHHGVGKLRHHLQNVASRNGSLIPVSFINSDFRRGSRRPRRLIFPPPRDLFCPSSLSYRDNSRRVHLVITNIRERIRLAFRLGGGKSDAKLGCTTTWTAGPTAGSSFMYSCTTPCPGGEGEQGSVMGNSVVDACAYRMSSRLIGLPGLMGYPPPTYFQTPIGLSRMITEDTYSTRKIICIYSISLSLR